MLGIQQLLNVVANTPAKIPVAVEFNGVAYPLGAAEVRGGILVLEAHDSGVPGPAAKRVAKSKPAATASTDASGENMELK